MSISAGYSRARAGRHKGGVLRGWNATHRVPHPFPGWGTEGDGFDDADDCSSGDADGYGSDDTDGHGISDARLAGVLIQTGDG